ncbi:hypothetical protein [Microbacterium sp. CJ77]|uniref:hypothetical protein n=1 Tax=Microbacterium sp. CJ77 TaxID=2079201 RepID=UPI000CD8AC9B|nr:hypothetical protein [Microbacterium sp. CJ77]
MRVDFSPWRLREAPASDALDAVAHRTIAALLAQARSGRIPTEDAAAQVHQVRSFVQSVDGYDATAIAGAIAELQSELDKVRQGS